MTSARMLPLFTLLAFVATAPARAAAQDAYPSRPVYLVVPFPPGGPTDTFARLLADRLQAAFGQSFIVDNRPGATGTTGTSAVARAAPDGYTLLFASNSSHVLAPLLKSPPPYDPLKDFKPVSMLLNYPVALVVGAHVPARTLEELIALANERPGKLNLGIFGRGSGGHLVAEMFNAQAKISATQIPYRGVAPLQQALVASEIDYFIDSIGSSKPLIDAGRVRALAVTGSRRLAAAPDVPTFQERGYLKGFEGLIWLGLLAPAGTPEAIVQRLASETKKIVALPEMRERIATYASNAVGSTPEEFVRFIETEQPVWAEVIRANDIKAD